MDAEVSTPASEVDALSSTVSPAGSAPEAGERDAAALSPRTQMETKKLANRSELEQALATLKIDLNRNEMRLMFRDVDDEFLVREREAQRVERLRVRAERAEKRKQKAAIMAKTKGSQKMKTAADNVRVVARVLNNMRPEMAMEACLHADSKFHKSFLKDPKPGIGNSTLLCRAASIPLPNLTHAPAAQVII